MQERWFDYRDTDNYTSEAVNTQFAKLFNAGVLYGFSLTSNGAMLRPGALITTGGIKIEDDSSVALYHGTNYSETGIPEGDLTYPRYDLIVCHYRYAKSEEENNAQFRIITGTPSSDPQMPVIPDDCTLVARAYMEPNATGYSGIEYALAECLINCEKNQHSYNIISGDLAALRIVSDVANGDLSYMVYPPSGLSDGSEIDWDESTPIIFDHEGLQALKELAGAGRTDETVKEIADSILNLLDDFTDHNDDTAPHDASAVALSVSGLNSNNLEDGLEEVYDNKLDTVGGDVGDLSIGGDLKTSGQIAPFNGGVASYSYKMVQVPASRMKTSIYGWTFNGQCWDGGSSGEAYIPLNATDVDSDSGTYFILNKVTLYISDGESVDVSLELVRNILSSGSTLTSNFSTTDTLDSAGFETLEFSIASTNANYYHPNAYQLRVTCDGDIKLWGAILEFKESMYFKSDES